MDTPPENYCVGLGSKGDCDREFNRNPLGRRISAKGNLQLRRGNQQAQVSLPRTTKAGLHAQMKLEIFGNYVAGA
ncbi:hypothetical protein Csa_006244 [Cucumis sativus]|uniref:Uncharacterized protein n=1 Tax=Cucumis sativus TaxID=3659 RepID=A0A0A0LKJ3_CUCSA|nr:hypothetical protein Csa_006244 [Cucumis sativus]